MEGWSPSLFASENGCWANLHQPAQGICRENGDDYGEGHRNRIHDEPRLRGDAKHCLAQSDGENNSCCRTDHAAGKAEQRSFRKKETQHSPHGAADRLHQADVVLALHCDVGHGGHYTQGGEKQNYCHGCRQNSRDAVIEPRFAFRELPNGADFNFRELLLKSLNSLVYFLGSSADKHFHHADTIAGICKTLSWQKWHKSLVIFRTAASKNGNELTRFRSRSIFELHNRTGMKFKPTSELETRQAFILRVVRRVFGLQLPARLPVFQ